MSSNLSFLGMPNTPLRKRFSIAAFPVNDNLINDNKIEALDLSLDIFDKDIDGNTSLMKAIIENRPLAVQNIMKKAYTTNSTIKLLTLTNKKGETPLQLASEGSNLAIKEYLEGIKVKRINPLLEKIKISTGRIGDIHSDNLNILHENIKPNMFGTTVRHSFVPTIAENEQRKYSDELLLPSTPRLRSISVSGEFNNGNNALEEHKNIAYKKTSFPCQDLKDVISNNELSKIKNYSSIDSGVFSKKNSTLSTKSYNELEGLPFNIDESRKYSLPKHRHVDGAIDIATNFFPVARANDDVTQNPKTSVVLMLSDKMKNFVKKKEGYQGYSSYDTQLLYMPREEDEDNDNDLINKSKYSNDLLDLNEYQLERYGLKSPSSNKTQKNQDLQIDIGNNVNTKNRSQSLFQISDKTISKY